MKKEEILKEIAELEKQICKLESIGYLNLNNQEQNLLLCDEIIVKHLKMQLGEC